MLSLFCGFSASLSLGWCLLDLLSAQNRALPVPSWLCTLLCCPRNSNNVPVGPCLATTSHSVPLALSQQRFQD